MPSDTPPESGRKPSGQILRFLPPALILAGCLIPAVAVRWRLGTILFLDRDYWGYLSPALSLLSGKPFIAAAARQFPYPLFVATLVKVFHDYAAVVVAQVAIGGLAATIGALCLRRMADGGRRAPGSLALGAAVAFAVLFLWLPSPLVYEHLLRPEAVTPLFLAATTALLLRYGLGLEAGAGPAWPLALLGGVSAMCYFTKTNWGLALAVPVVGWLVGQGVWGLGSRRAFVLGLVGLGVVFAPLAVYQASLERRFDAYEAKTFLPKMLFAWNAPAISDLLAADLRAEAPPFPRELIAAVRAVIEAERERQRHERDVPYASLGFNPEPLVFGGDGLNAAAPFKRLGPEGEKRFLLHYFARYVVARPDRYAARVARQLALLYTFDSAAYRTPYCGMPVGWFATESTSCLADHAMDALSRVPEHAAYAALLREAPPDGRCAIPCPARLIAVLRLTFFPAVWVSVGAFVWCVIGRRRGSAAVSPGMRLTAYMSLSCFATAFLVDLTTALANSLEVPRFFEFHLYLTLFGQVSAGVFVLLAGRALWARRHS